MPSTIGGAIVVWIFYGAIFGVFGGLGAGVTVLLWNLAMSEPFSDLLSAVIFGGYGLIAYRLAQRLFEQRRLS